MPSTCEHNVFLAGPIQDRALADVWMTPRYLRALYDEVARDVGLPDRCRYRYLTRYSLVDVTLQELSERFPALTVTVVYNQLESGHQGYIVFRGGRAVSYGADDIRWESPAGDRLLGHYPYAAELRASPHVACQGQGNPGSADEPPAPPQEGPAQMAPAAPAVCGADEGLPLSHREFDVLRGLLHASELNPLAHAARLREVMAAAAEERLARGSDDPDLLRTLNALAPKLRRIAPAGVLELITRITACYYADACEYPATFAAAHQPPDPDDAPWGT